MKYFISIIMILLAVNLVAQTSTGGSQGQKETVIPDQNATNMVGKVSTSDGRSDIDPTDYYGSETVGVLRAPQDTVGGQTECAEKGDALERCQSSSNQSLITNSLDIFGPSNRSVVPKPPVKVTPAGDAD